MDTKRNSPAAKIARVSFGNGRFHLGTWQGIYLCEHRNRGGSRRLVVTVHGE
jgi:thiamine phosphate synthase YjbQ (UPF0047 family)